MASSKPSDRGFTVDNRVGRLLEARVFRLHTIQDALLYSQEIAAWVNRMPREPSPVLCADHRPVVIYTQEVADRLSALFQDMNSRLGRIAILVAPSNATLSLQLHRIVREAGYEHRRVFLSATDAQAHLTPVLDAAEAERVRSFLAGFSR